MSILRSLALLSLSLAFCIGCSDNQQSWEGGKSQSSGKKKVAKSEDVKDNDATEESGDADNPHKTVSPQGVANPHGGIGGMGMGGESKTAVESDGTLAADAARFSVPKAWVPKPHIPMFLAEFALPKAEGDKEDGRLTVSHMGGTLEGNVGRWKGQFGDKLEKENEDTIQAGSVKIVVVDFTGTFNDSRGPMMMSAAPAVPRPDYRMLGAIFQLPGDDTFYFIKCYGPKKTITERAEEIKGFLKSLKVEK